MTKDNRRFRRGSGIYKCRSCGKKTRETGGDESGVELCLACYDDAGNENEHNDTHDAPVGGCRFCEAEAIVAKAETPTTYEAFRSEFSPLTLSEATPADLSTFGDELRAAEEDGYTLMVNREPSLFYRLRSTGAADTMVDCSEIVGSEAVIVGALYGFAAEEGWL